jgi:hypothetical protein
VLGVSIPSAGLAVDAHRLEDEGDGAAKKVISPVSIVSAPLPRWRARHAHA